MTLTFGPRVNDPSVNQRGEEQRWFAVNDGVMGGVSHSTFRIEAGMGCFIGEVSLENGGGFASIRRQPDHFEPSLTNGEGLTLRVNGDGRTYQLRLKSTALDEASAYRVIFTPARDQWETLKFTWHMFEAVRRGKVLDDAPSLSSDSIYQLGFLIADRTAGPFRLNIASIAPL
ncbi:CIA30 family protein [Vreelandella zhaodongensis]|uniref:CIA30 family protein n=1 Tax=Vreelandella zhaodongensis TaxID=1176240 RepID=A0ABX2SSX9_VREZH|nr:CIA30 family protein [Halomonas zhaodongensis]NYS45201.1 CIA30 family protein [Halomonas zhaodongensis]